MIIIAYQTTNHWLNSLSIFNSIIKTALKNHEKALKSVNCYIASSVVNVLVQNPKTLSLGGNKVSVHYFDARRLDLYSLKLAFPSLLLSSTVQSKHQEHLSSSAFHFRREDAQICVSSRWRNHTRSLQWNFRWNETKVLMWGMGKNAVRRTGKEINIIELKWMKLFSLFSGFNDHDLSQQHSAVAVDFIIASRRFQTHTAQFRSFIRYLITFKFTSIQFLNKNKFSDRYMQRSNCSNIDNSRDSDDINIIKWNENFLRHFIQLYFDNR